MARATIRAQEVYERVQPRIEQRLGHGPRGTQVCRGTMKVAVEKNMQNGGCSVVQSSRDSEVRSTDQDAVTGRL